MRVLMLAEDGLAGIARSDTARWIVLRNADAGQLMLGRPGGPCYRRGQPMAPHLRPTVALLLDERLLTVVERPAENGCPSLRVVLTDAGTRRLAELTELRTRDRRRHQLGPDSGPTSGPDSGPDTQTERGIR